MRLIIALILPWLTFFTIGRPLAGIVCLILQITLIGWLPAAIWAVYALSQYQTDQKEPGLTPGAACGECRLIHTPRSPDRVGRGHRPRLQPPRRAGHERCSRRLPLRLGRRHRRPQNVGHAAPG